MTVDDVLSGRLRWTLVHGDMLEVLERMPDACVDAVITDPPYSSGGQFRGDRTRSPRAKYVGSDVLTNHHNFAGDTRDQRSFAYWSALWLSQCLRLAKPGAPLCVFTDWRQLPSVTDAIQAAGWVWRGIVPWDKENARPVPGRFCAQCEYVVWGSAGPMALKREISAASRILPGVIRCKVKPREKRHMTGKPVELMRQVTAICRPGGVILDPFAGSGSTGVAALAAEHGLRFIGVEKTNEYAHTARSWLAEASGHTVTG